MTYPGNPSLSADAQQRILGTFQQTLDLAEQGSRQEALLGCDFVLRMDPHFEPARRLLDRLKLGTGAVQVADLKDAPESALGDDFLDNLDLEELPGLEDDLSGFAGNGGLGGGDLRTELQELLDARRFQDLLTLAQQDAAAVAADPELRKIAESAQERLEAEPYVTKFLAKARQAAQAGQSDEVARMLERARSLDPSHPGIAELERAAAPAPPAPAAPTIELPAALRPTSTPPVDLFSGGGGGDSESERRIAQLLAEGQTAFDAGDPQAAIDAWSRIFLIDIDHQEAARRIDQARKLKAENERQVEEVFHDGLNHLESGDLAAARRAFEQVLALQPSYLAAREYVQQIDAGEIPVLAPRSASREMPAAHSTAPSPSTGEHSALSLPDLGEASGELKEEILVPPEPGEMPARGERRERREPRRATDRQGKASKRFLYIGGGVLAVVLLAAGFLYLKWDSLFPNLPNEHPATAGPGPTSATNPIPKALALHNQGKAANAVALLQRLPPTDPHYAEAQKLIAQWAAAGPAPAVGTEAAPGATPAAALPPEAAARRQQLLASAHQEVARGDYLEAANHFELAAGVAKLEPPELAQQAEVQHKLQPLVEQIKLFKQHDWEYIVPTLWRMREGNPGDRAINRLLVDSYYNLGVRDLQRADPLHAASQFTEALKLDPGDAALRRHYLFAQTYQERPQDLLFRIYVKYLPYR